MKRPVVIAQLLTLLISPGGFAAPNSGKRIICKSADGNTVTVRLTSVNPTEPPVGEDFSILPRPNALIELQTAAGTFSFSEAYVIKDKGGSFRIHGYKTGDEGYISSLISGQVSLEAASRKHFLTAKYRLTPGEAEKTDFQAGQGKRTYCDMRYFQF